MASHAATFFLLCFILSLRACNCRFQPAKHFDHGQDLVPEPVKEMKESKLQVSEILSAMKNLWAAAANDLVSQRKRRCANGGSHIQSSETGVPKIKGRRLTSAAQEVDVNDHDNDVVQEAVVMDYAHPHRKPPIHNEEN